MAKRVHFEDDIFYINIRIRMLHDALLLDLDPDFFLEQTLLDIEFIDRVLDILKSALEQAERLIEREEQLINLSDTEEQFYNFILSILNGKGSIGESCMPLAERFVQLQKQSDTRRKELSALSGRDANTGVDDPLLVSPRELNELLGGME